MLIYEKVYIKVFILKNDENDDSTVFKYVKLHFKELLYKTLFR